MVVTIVTFLRKIFIFLRIYFENFLIFSTTVSAIRSAVALIFTHHHRTLTPPMVQTSRLSTAATDDDDVAVSPQLLDVGSFRLKKWGKKKSEKDKKKNKIKMTQSTRATIIKQAQAPTTQDLLRLLQQTIQAL